jgi:hypothetical protein
VLSSISRSAYRAVEFSHPHIWGNGTSADDLLLILG